jgi:uncharacterized protein (TIGR02266 family)
MPNQRMQQRVHSEIRVQYRTVGSFLSDYVLNLSKGGMFIHTANPLPPESLVRLVFSLPGVPFLFDVTGKVKWAQKDFDDEDNLPGMGIEFVQLDQRVRMRIEAHVEKLRQEQPAGEAERPSPRPRIEVHRPSGSGPQREESTQRKGRPLGDRSGKGEADKS